MKNRDIYQRDPSKITLLNNGVATMTDALTDDERRTLRFELEHFVCEGEYQRGLVRILDSYVSNQGQPEQPAAWVSGFFGSGKSHLAKMLRFLWTDYTFPEDGASARGLARLPNDVQDLLKEITTLGKRAAWTSRGGGNVRRWRRRQCSARVARHRVQVRGAARELSAGALLPVAQEERYLRPGLRRGGGARARLSPRAE